MQETIADVDAHLLAPVAATQQPGDAAIPKPPAPEPVPDPEDRDLLPWLMRRLAASRILARQLQADAVQIRQALARQDPEVPAAEAAQAN